MAGWEVTNLEPVLVVSVFVLKARQIWAEGKTVISVAHFVKDKSKRAMK